jgi:hypothetical protein
MDGGVPMSRGTEADAVQFPCGGVSMKAYLALAMILLLGAALGPGGADPNEPSLARTAFFVA